MTPPAPDSFDSPDGRTYSGPVTAGTPGQALAARWRETADELEEGRFSDSPGNTAEAETLRECARQLDAVAAQGAQPAPGLHDPAPGVSFTADRQAAGKPDITGIQAALHGRTPQPAPELAAAMAETRQLRQGISKLVVKLSASAIKTHPSKKSDIETDLAEQLQKLLEGKS